MRDIKLEQLRSIVVDRQKENPPQDPNETKSSVLMALVDPLIDVIIMLIIAFLTMVFGGGVTWV
jgi:hypothetical protein